MVSVRKHVVFRLRHCGGISVGESKWDVDFISFRG